MKNELDHFRKFSIVDYSVNLKKFKEYLDYCKKNNLSEEKLYILENLVNQTNEKSQSGLTNLTQVLNDFTNLCVLVIIFSDFEIENFSKISNFSLNFQKTVLFQAINYCIDRTKELHENVFIKFQFWVLKLMNKNISVTGDTIPIPPVSAEELSQSLESLSKKIESSKISDMSLSAKLFYLKISFELGYYYYLTNDFEKMKYYFKYCVNNMNSEGYNSAIYFSKEEISKLLKVCEKYKFMMSGNEDVIEADLDVEMNIECDKQKELLELEADSKIVESDFENFFNKISIDPQAKLIIDKYSIDDLKTLDLFSIEELIKYSKHLIFLSFKNFNRLQDAKLYITKIQEIISSKLNQLSTSTPENEKKELTFAKKENAYHIILISLIESVYNGEERLKKNFLKEVSSSILTLTLTDDLQISGIIHGLIINFSQSFKNIVHYFNDFVEFFQHTSDNSIETVNQIFIISSVLKIINLILSPVEKSTSNSNSVVITGQIHNELFNYTFFWLESLKDKKTNRNDNILFILMRTIKNSNFLLVLKVIYLAILRFVIEKKNISSSPNDEIFEQIYMNNPNFYKIDTLINENKNNEKFSNLNIQFREDVQLNCKFDGLYLDFFEATLFKLIKKIEKKVIRYGKFSELEFLERRNNLLFFEFKSVFNHLSSQSVSSNPVEGGDTITKTPSLDAKIIIEFIKYFKTKFQKYKLNFHRIDCFENIKLINEYYSEFKKNLDEVVLLRLIYILSCLGKNIDASVLLQYTKRIDYDLAYKLLKKNVEFHNIDKLEYIWKISYFELLANIYHTGNKLEHLSVVSNLIRRTSNHQYFKRHPLRKLFKILNFFKFIDNLNI